MTFESLADMQDENWRQGSGRVKFMATILVLEVAEPNLDNAGKFSNRYLRPLLIAYPHVAALHDPACFLQCRSLTVVQVRHHFGQLR